MEISGSIANIFPALAKAKSEFDKIIKDTDNPYLTQQAKKPVKYADLETVIAATESSLAKNDLILITSPVSNASGIGIQPLLLHKSGEYIRGDVFTLPLAKSDAQTGVAAVTYARRCVIKAIFNLVEADDDGETASGRGPEKKATKSLKSTAALKEKNSPAKTSSAAPAQPSAEQPTTAEQPATNEEYQEYRNRASDFCNNLKLWGMEGDIKAKFAQYFLKKSGVKNLRGISKAKWDEIFGVLERMQSQPEGGRLVVKTIEEAIA